VYIRREKDKVRLTTIVAGGLRKKTRGCASTKLRGGGGKKKAEGLQIKVNARKGTSKEPVVVY